MSQEEDNKEKKSEVASEEQPNLKNLVQIFHAMYTAQLLRSDSMPNLIIDNLYLGSVGAAHSLDSLKKLSITHVLCVADSLAPKFPDQFQYLHIKIMDSMMSNIRQHFDEAHKFIDQGRKSGKVLVHCMAGVSRSATIVISYLMKTEKLPLQNALEHVRVRRAIIDPNPGFRAQLARFEKDLEEMEKGRTNVVNAEPAEATKDPPP